MKTRMQPIGNVWNKFPRVVRDLAHACGKRVNLELDGIETELDRTIIEAIKDPLTHAVRNAVDHGVESPEKRKAAGKSETGTVVLRAFHEGGQVNIEVSDDGGGLDIERIRARAIERGLVAADKAARMSEREVGHFIFHPGFSTAEKVTNVSGRGVGMDVVKTNIEKIGGTVDISSRFGQSTTLKIKIPLTLAIIPALIVTCSSLADDPSAEGYVLWSDVKPTINRFAIPQVNLLELVRLEGAQAKRGIERIHGTTVYRLRGHLLPLVFLNKALELKSPANERQRPHQHRRAPGRRSTVRSRRRRDSRHRRDRRQTAWERAQGHYIVRRRHHHGRRSSRPHSRRSRNRAAGQCGLGRARTGHRRQEHASSGRRRYQRVASFVPGRKSRLEWPFHCRWSRGSKRSP